MINLFSGKLKMIVFIAILTCFIVIPATAQQICSNETGTNGGYWYTFWKDNQGSVCMTMGAGGQFSVQWSNTGNFVCGKGWSTGSENRTITWTSNNGNAQYVGLYGWMQNPLVEYYIPRSGGTNRGTYQADGRTYTLYTNTRVNMPSIEGTKTFEQYFCGGGSGGSVNFGEHCAGWRQLGMGVGSQNYQVVAIEGWGGSSGSASATVGEGPSNPTPSPTPAGTPGPTPIPGTVALACGSSSAVGIFQADQYFSGGSTYNNTNTINMSQITSDPPPAALFNNERYGAMSYTIPGFTSGSSYIVTLYFAETYLTSAGSRLFNVSINGETALANFDIYATAGGENRAIAESFTTRANSSGQIVIQFTAGTENPKINGLYIKPGSGPTIPPTPTPITTPTPTPTPPVSLNCNVSFSPANSTQALNSTFKLDVVVDSGNQALAAYSFSINYNPAIISVVTVEEGADGFIAAVNTEPPGSIIASGFSTTGTGTGPGSNLQVLSITFTAVSEGTSPLELYVDEIVDNALDPIGDACGKNGSVTVSIGTGLLGDANGDGQINIIDALVIAQAYVGLEPTPFLPENADTDCNGKIDIVDALMVAQYYVDLISGFCR
jgi:hypothetical protein